MALVDRLMTSKSNGDSSSSTSPPSKAASAAVSLIEKKTEEALPSVGKTGSLSPQLPKACTSNPKEDAKKSPHLSVLSLRKPKSRNSSEKPSLPSTDLSQAPQPLPPDPGTAQSKPSRLRLPNSSPMDYNVWNDSVDPSPSESESDSDQDLPDMLSCPEVSKALPQKGDPVWVKHRNYNFWPCLVLSSNHKTKKINVLFLDQTNGINVRLGERIYLKYNRKKVLPYNHQNKKQFEAEGSSLTGPLQKSFQAAILNMEDYLTKRALGHITPYHHFFGDTSASSSGLVGDSMSNVTHGNEGSLSETNDKQEENRPLNCTADTTTPANKCRNPTRKRTLTPDERRERRKKTNEPLVDYICAEDMKDYLFKIWKRHIPSERHEKFFKGQKERRELQETSFGPIDDDDQLDKIIENLGQWWQEASGETIPNTDYLFGVWLPEAIVKGLCKFKKVGMTKAWEYFRQGIKLSKVERKEIQDSLLGRIIHTT
ncbi:uncharacterized protein LOC112553584 isoform X2 [Pomacea canaliculata]|uniref:uncharacterized protein LOC112553584 isoform X2 n=1 Tax=Pomacea canaliculata TaxID=400727 RepID=UPI000D73B7E7|nr:uncharacterized protein LOC112553584 isoform X2 [Pomacea canaliculata]